MKVVEQLARCVLLARSHQVDEMLEKAFDRPIRICRKAIVASR
jgi:hypothetical protein